MILSRHTNKLDWKGIVYDRINSHFIIGTLLAFHCEDRGKKPGNISIYDGDMCCLGKPNFKFGAMA